MNLKEQAKKAAEKNVNKSALLENREKIRLEELVAQHGKKLHIVGVDIVQVNEKDEHGKTVKKDAAVMVVSEAPFNWAFGGGVLLSIINEWLSPDNDDENGGDGVTIEFINKELEKNPLEVELEKRAQKNDPRKSFWHYEIL